MPHLINESSLPNSDGDNSVNITSSMSTKKEDLLSTPSNDASFKGLSSSKQQNLQDDLGSVQNKVNGATDNKKLKISSVPAESHASDRKRDRDKMLSQSLPSIEESVEGNLGKRRKGRHRRNEDEEEATKKNKNEVKGNKACEEPDDNADGNHKDDAKPIKKKRGRPPKKKKNSKEEDEDDKLVKKVIKDVEKDNVTEVKRTEVSKKVSYLPSWVKLTNKLEVISVQTRNENFDLYDDVDPEEIVEVGHKVFMNHPQIDD